jgi:predicted dehydrogenase/aryl-alcohol dehydrogenase-like predicted oxidoreductase
VKEQFMTDRPVGWGIIGAGGIARRFASQLPSSATGHLAAVASRDRDRAEKFAAAHGAARAYDSYESLLADPEIQVVYIATPHTLHAPWTIKAAEAGKHVLCEKPLAVNRAEAMAVIEAAATHDVFLMEAYMYRCHPQTRRLIDLISSGAIGAVHHIQASFAFAADPATGGRLFDPQLAGGGILDVGGYPVSMARLIASTALGHQSAEVSLVTASGTVGHAGVDEWAVATVTFSGGITAQLATGIRLAADNSLTVYGSTGYARLSQPWVPPAEAATQIALHRVGHPAEQITVEPAPVYACEADTVAAHLGDRQAPEMTWNDSLATMAILDQWRDALALTYPFERDDATISTVHRRPLRRLAGHTMRYGQIPGIAKPVSRLVMGVDNQPNLPYATVMFDDFAERGGNCFDTAYIYGGGRLERLLGQWVRNRGMRDQIVIIAKGAHTPHCDPESLTSQLHETLDRLGTDHVDLYFMHRDNPEIPVGEFIDVLHQHHDAGLIRAYGVSNWTIERFDAANNYATRERRLPFVALSNHFSLAEAREVPWEGCQHVTDPLSRAWLAEKNITLVPWSSQARGFFAGRADPADRTNAELVRCYYADINFARLSRARQLADKHAVPTTAIALAYVLAQPFPTFPLIGPRTLTETRTSLEALTINLTPEEVTWLESGTGQP